MQVVRERPCQRRFHRVTAPFLIRVNGEDELRAVDWSVGGARISGLRGDLPQLEDALELKCRLPFQGFDISFPVGARVVRVDAETGTIAVAFENVGERERDLMQHFIEDLIRGKMASIDDTICRIDIPVTPISTQPDTNATKGTPVRRLPIKTVVMGALYLVGGFGIFAYITVLLYSSFAHLEVKTAVVSRPLHTVTMPADGIVRPARFTEGDTVRRGDLIAEVSDPKLDAQIREAELRVAEAKSALWRAEERYQIKARQQELLQTISQSNRDIASARVTARREALRAADDHLQRMQTLFNKGLTTRVKLDGAIVDQEKIAASLRELELELEQATLMSEVSGRRHYNHKEFVIDLDLDRVEIEDLRADLDIAIARSALLQERKMQNVIRAPFDGAVVKVVERGEGAARRDDPLMVIEEATEASVVAFLKQDEILEIGLQDTATIYVPSLSVSLEARVVRVDRSTAYVDGEIPHYRWRNDDDRTAVVVLKLAHDTQEAHSFADRMASGLPAVVVFNRRNTSELNARIADAAPWT